MVQFGLFSERLGFKIVALKKEGFTIMQNPRYFMAFSFISFPSHLF